MNSSALNFRDHIKPLFIADSVFTLGIVILILEWMYGDDPNFLGGFLHNEKSLSIGIGLGLTIGGGILLANEIRKLIRARQHNQ